MTGVDHGRGVCSIAPPPAAIPVRRASECLELLRGLPVLGPGHTAIVTTAEPFFVATLAALVLDQPIRIRTVLGGSLIAVAVLLLQRSGRAGGIRPTAEPGAVEYG